MKRTRHQRGSVVFDRRRKVWNYLFSDNGVRRTRLIGSLRDFPSKAAAWRRAESIHRASQPSLTVVQTTVRSLIERYRKEKMPQRATTQRGYTAWLENHILPRWGDHCIAEVQARPVELWLQSLQLAPKSKMHIRGLLSILWDYAMWCGDVPTQRNPMELVTIKGVPKRVRVPRSLTVEQFQRLLSVFNGDTCMRTMLLIAVSFGLRISELLGLKWSDVNWLNKTLRIERGVVKQIMDDVKSVQSAQTMVIADELLDVLKTWKQTTQFSDNEDWMFASLVKIGRQPLSYTHVWYTLNDAATKAGIGHVSSHSFRHTHRTWLDSVGTPVGVQQRLMRHSDIRTTMNLYGDAVTEDMRQAHEKVVRLALPRA
jgi:integrase